MPDRIDATVDAVESAGGQAVLDRGPGESGHGKLGNGGHAVLARRDAGDRSVRLGALARNGRHNDHKSPTAAGAPYSTRCGRRARIRGRRAARAPGAPA